ncbi:MAG: Gfo/Idh/MocA family oxidoreductase [Nitrospira sp.]
MPRILIAGLGSIGLRHLNNLLQLGEKDILLLRTQNEPVKEAPNLPVYTNLQDALLQNPEAVIVSNPTSHHMDVAMQAARAGCNLFVEKPLSHTWENVENLLALAKEKRIIGMVGFDMHFDPGLQKVRQLLKEGTIGHITAIQAQVGQYLPDWHPWEDYRKGVSAQVETGGGVILDLIHEIDYVTWLMGGAREVISMNDHVSTLEIETEDTASIMIRFKNNAIGTINLDYIQRTLSRSSRIVGEEGTITWDLLNQKVSWFLAEDKAWHDFSYAGFQRNDRFLAEMKHFLDCLQGRAEPEVNLESGGHSLKIALAAKESGKTGKVVVLS